MKPIPEELKQHMTGTNPIVMTAGSPEAWELEACFYAQIRSQYGYIKRVEVDSRHVLFHLWEPDAETCEIMADKARKFMSLQELLDNTQARIKAMGPTHTCPHCGYDLDDFVDQIMEDR